MAKAASKNKQQTVSQSDQALYYDALNYIPVEEKDEIWGAKWLYYAKTHSQPFQDPTEAAAIRKKMSGTLDVAAHKKMIDPALGLAEFFHSDYKACPIDQHLDEIIETTIKQIPLSLSVKAVDEISVSNKEQNSRKVKNRGLLAGVINQVNKELGFPQLKKGDDPFKYIQQMQTKAAQAQQQPAAAGAPAPGSRPASGGSPRKTVPTDILETLLSEIDSNYLLGIYNTYLHKEGVEIACELGIDYYLNVLNKFNLNYATNLLSDMKAFNKCCFRLYTSQTTGTPQMDYYRPEEIEISDYSLKDLSDINFWLVEKDIPFSEFTRKFGAECNAGQLEEIFNMNRKFRGASLYYNQCDSFARNASKIRIGYMEFESQDMEVYAEYQIMGNNAYKKQPSDFVPGYKKVNGQPVKDPNSQNSVRDESHYNVWYKQYYIPYYMFDTKSASTDYIKQAKYIYQFGKLQDQERYGDREKFAKSSLIGFYSDRMTWFEIKDRIKGKIDHLWLLFQNDMANIMPHGLNWAYDMIVQNLKTSDAPNKTNKTGVTDWARKLKETGSAITKLLRDKDGNIMANQPPFTEIKTGHLEAALGKLDAILNLYAFMLKALGQNDLSDGDAPKPRTNLGSIQLSLGTSGKATFYLEEGFTDILASAGNKLLKYFSDIVEYGDSARLKELENIVGRENMAALGEIKGIPLRELGMYVEPVMTKEQKEQVMQIAQSMASAGTLDEATALFLTFIDNLKQAYAILIFKKAQMDKQLAAQEQQKQQFQLQLIQAQTQQELLKIQASGEVKKQLELLLGQVEQKLETLVINLKGHWTMAGKEQINQNRIEQSITESNIEKLNQPGGDAMPMSRHMPVAS